MDGCEQKVQSFDNSLRSLHFLHTFNNLFESFQLLRWVNVLFDGELVEVEGHGVERVDILLLKEVRKSALRVRIVPHFP